MTMKNYQLQADPPALAKIMNEYEDLARKVEAMPDETPVTQVVDASVAVCEKLFEFMQQLMPADLALDVALAMAGVPEELAAWAAE